MKQKVLCVLLLLLFPLLLTACQSAEFSDVHEAQPTEAAPTRVPRPTLDPNATKSERADYYRDAVEWAEGVVEFSSPSGFYTKDVSLKLTAEGASDIFYTDDGSEPRPQSNRYTQAIRLSVSTTKLSKSVVIRAVAYYPDGTKSPVFTQTYFLDTKIKSRFSTLVFSIAAPPDELTTGPSALLVGDRALDTGEYAKRTVQLQVFSAKGAVLVDQPATLRVYGDSSRKKAVKSLMLTAGTGEEEDKQVFAYSFFGTSTMEGTVLDRYTQVVLSNGEADFQYAFIRDEYALALMKLTGFPDYEDVQPAVVYINGEYYGLHWLHEVYSNDFFQVVYGASDGRYAVIDWSADGGAVPLEKADQEAASAFQSAYEQLLKADLREEENIARLRRLIDVENYLDYCAMNIFIDNPAWPGQMRLYAYIPADGSAADAQWRFLPHGMDGSFGLKGSKDAVSRDTLGEACSPESERYAPLFAKLMAQEEFRAYFADKMTELLSEKLTADALASVLKDLHNERNTEMQNYFTRLDALKKVRNSGISMKKSDFTSAYNDLTKYVKARPAAVKAMLEAFLAQPEPEPEEEPPVPEEEAAPEEQLIAEEAESAPEEQPAADEPV